MAAVRLQLVTVGTNKAIYHWRLLVCLSTISRIMEKLLNLHKIWWKKPVIMPRPQGRGH